LHKLFNIPSMNKLLLSFVVATLAGCAAPKPMVNVAGTSPTQQETAECELEAMKATANILNVMEAGWMKAEIRRKCLNVKGYK
jgi:hypothetical protein